MKGAGGSSPFTPKQADGSPPQRRTRSFCSSASSRSTSTSPSPSPSPSPAHHNLHSIIPFSWEQHPGVPKKKPAVNSPSSSPADLLLPLPPPLRSTSGASFPRRKRPDPRSPVALDPFAAALAECAKDRPAGDDELEKLWMKGAAGRRGAAIGGWPALADLYGCCKAACSVAESTIRIPRSGHHAGSYDLLLNRRAG